jgi:hypothetical protein
MTRLRIGRRYGCKRQQVLNMKRREDFCLLTEHDLHCAQRGCASHDHSLRKVNFLMSRALNLLVVFDAVMQERQAARPPASASA